MLYDASMTENAKADKTSLVEDLKALTAKQVLSIVVAMFLALVLQTYGFAEQCLGFLIIAAVLYMIPHLFKVSSVKVKTLIGTVFVVLALITSTFISGPSIVDSAVDQIDKDNSDFGNIQYVENEDSTVTITVDIYTDRTENITVTYGEVGFLNYRSFGFVQDYDEKMTVTPWGAGGDVLATATVTIPVTENALNGYQIIMEKFTLDDDGNKVVDDDGNVKTEKSGLAFLYDTGIDNYSLYKIAFSGLWVYVAFTAVMFFLILIFSALMRRSAEKSRAKMEAEGRLYPKGYGRCKQCGGMVLPGEVNCRKCGAYIDVPDELRAQKKDYFVCENCGAEVPNDADICPKCGAKFDSVEN